MVQVSTDAEDLVREVLRSGQLTQGPMVERLEREFATRCGHELVIAVNNGTAALEAALEALGVGPGDEVVTSPFTFVATVNAILHVGATVRFADITSDFTVDPEAVAAQLTTRTAAIMPVHLYGQMADMLAIEDLAERHGVSIIEDAAQAHGAAVGERPAGSFGVGCFSLYATKNVTSAEGGLITTDDAGLADRLRVLRNQGMRQRYECEMAGHNYRLSDVHAAIALPQVAALSQLNERRRSNAARLSAGLDDVPGLELPSERPGRRHVWHQYTVRVTADARQGRDELAAFLHRAGVGTGVYYPRTVLDYDCYRNDDRVIQSDVPRATEAARQVLSLPVHPWLSEADLDQVISTVRDGLCG